MGISAGRLRQRIDIMRLVENDTGLGGYVDVWTPIAAAVPAEVLGLTGTEAVREKVLRGIRVYQITTRYRDDLLPKDQLRFGGEDLNVRSIVDPVGRRDRLVIVADTEGAAKTS